MPKMPHLPEKILVIRLSSLGDIVLLVPELVRMRNAAPSAEIHLLTKRRYAEIFDGNTYLDEVLAVDHGGPAELAAMRRRLARERYDAVIDAHGVWRSAFFLHSLRAKRKVRIRKDEIAKLALIAGKLNLYRRLVTQSERYARLFEALGVPAGGERPALPLPSPAVAAADAALRSVFPEGSRVVALAPGARWETKRWPVGCFAELARLLSRRGFRIALVGGHGDETACAAIARDISPPPLDLAGRLPILGTAAVLARCAALVTNDSAPLHLAEAVGTPVLAIFGPTVRAFGYFPRLPRSVALETDLPCRPCSRNGARRCPYGTKECLETITPARAMEALAGILETVGARA